MTSCTKKKIGFRKHSQRVFKAKSMLATGLVAQRARNLPRKMHLNLSQKKKKALSLTSHPTLPRVSHCGLGSSWCVRGQLHRLLKLASSSAFPFHLEKHCSIFIQELVDLVLFFGTIHKKKRLFLLVFLTFTYQSGNS